MSTKDVTITFVLPTECDTEVETIEVMQNAYKLCKLENIDVKWCTQRECLELETSKTDIFVFQQFKGPTFDQIAKTKSVRLLGAWCLFICFTEGRPLPNYPWPIYSTAMLDCTVTCSSFSKKEKLQIQEKVQYMGGVFTQTLSANCTHLVTNSVKSEKYIKGVQNGIKIMKSSWLKEVWETCQQRNIHCDDEQFLNHKCPIFYNLQICCTGLNLFTRTELQKLVDANGGNYTESLSLKLTDIIICENGARSTKLKAAKKHNIKCVTMEWIRDSVQSGYAVPVDNYQVKVITSTPTNEREPILPNFSMISSMECSTMNTQRELFEATPQSLISNTPLSRSQGVKRKLVLKEHNQAVDNINLLKVKEAGTFLDGCGVYIIGFGNVQREKLSKILNFSGATRYDDYCDRVSHVLVGDASCHELKLLLSKNNEKNFVVVDIYWMLESIEKKCPVDEEKYLINSNIDNDLTPSSPLSKKSVEMIRRNNSTLAENVPSLLPTQSQSEEDIMLQYLLPNAKETNKTKLFLEPNKPEPKNIPYQESESTHRLIDEDSEINIEATFHRKKFIILGMTQEYSEQIKGAISSMGGKVVSNLFKGVPDYAIVPITGTSSKVSAIEIVNDLWISDCHLKNTLLPILYYHRPLSIKRSCKALKDCVIALCGYTNEAEKCFLHQIIVELGGTSQDSLSKSKKASFLISTHLISAKAEGKKYVAALKWGLPIVNHEWLLECSRKGEHLPEDQYLIRSTKNLQISTSNVTNGNSTTTMQSVIDKSGTMVCNEQKLGNCESFNSQPQNSQIKPLTQTNLTSNDDVSIAIQDIAANAGISWSLNGSSEKFDDLNLNNSILKSIEQLNVSEIIKRNNGEKVETPVRENNQSFKLDSIETRIAKKKRLEILNMPTPETPLGAFIDANPSKSLRKEMRHFIDGIKVPRWSTPLSEVKRRCFEQLCLNSQTPKDLRAEFEMDNQESNKDSTPQNNGLKQNVISEQLQELEDMLLTNSANKIKRYSSSLPVAAPQVKDSQSHSIGWDDEMKQQKKIFMFSGIESTERDEMMKQIEAFGGVAVNPDNFNLECTHLITTAPCRKEKILASMASGKWILHASYVNRCVVEGKLVDEEAYEFGNPKSANNINLSSKNGDENRALAIHYWRKEIQRRGYGAFHDMRVILTTSKREAFIRVIEAGGGMIVDVSPPFTQSVHATHCLLDSQGVTNYSDFIPLAQQGVYCVESVFINAFLQRTVMDIHDHIIPSLLQYYRDRNF